MLRNRWFVGFFLLSAVGCAKSDKSVCDQATAKLAACTGKTPEGAPESCEGDDRTHAELINGLTCDELSAPSGGKADSGIDWCSITLLWAGRCTPTPLSEIGKLSQLSEVCAGRSDALCTALNANDWTRAKDAIVQRAAAEPRETVVSDAAVRYYVRERVVSLFAYNVVTSRGMNAMPSDFSQQVDKVLTAMYPPYSPAEFVLAHKWLPPAKGDSCAQPKEALLFFPGVIRNGDRQEFGRPGEQMEALNAALPCLKTLRVESGSFVDPTKNADQAKKLVDKLDADLGVKIPLHFLGYSQGSTNALTTLVNYPELGARVRTVITMNSAAHGSEVGDTVRKVLDLNRLADCANFPAWARGMCVTVAGTSPRPKDTILDWMGKAMGMTLDQIRGFVEAEDNVTPAMTFSDFFTRHQAGIDSLTVAKANDFWAQKGALLPKNILYLSFRSAITNASLTDPDSQLPLSNAAFYELLKLVLPKVPYNDMQVRLVNQVLGGPIADVEVQLPVALGNHWLWELTPAAVPENVMSARMFSAAHRQEMFMAFYQTMAEVGLVFGIPLDVTIPDMAGQPVADMAIQPAADLATVAPAPDMAKLPRDMAVEYEQPPKNPQVPPMMKGGDCSVTSLTGTGPEPYGLAGVLAILFLLGASLRRRGQKE